MQSRAILCVIGAAVLGFGSASFAHDRDHHGGERYEQRHEHGDEHRADQRFTAGEHWQQSWRGDGGWRHEMRERRLERNAGWGQPRDRVLFVQQGWAEQPVYAGPPPALVVQTVPQATSWSVAQIEAQPVYAPPARVSVLKLKRLSTRPRQHARAPVLACTPQAAARQAHAPARAHVAQLASRRVG